MRHPTKRIRRHSYEGKLCDCGQPATHLSGGNHPECSGCHWRNLFYHSWSADSKQGCNSSGKRYLRIKFDGISFPSLRHS